MHENSILDTTNYVNTKKSEYKINIATPEQISRLSIFQIIGYIKKIKQDQNGINYTDIIAVLGMGIQKKDQNR